MKLTKETIKRIIKEELEEMNDPQRAPFDYGHDKGSGPESDPQVQAALAKVSPGVKSLYTKLINMAGDNAEEIKAANEYLFWQASD